MQVTNISICVLNWENYSDTRRCIAALLALPEQNDGDLNISVVVVDNGSRDESLIRLREFAAEISDSGARISLIGRSENGGYAVGNNTGIHYAIENQDPAYVWVLNNDTIPQPGSLRAMVDCARSDRSVGIWGSTILNADGSIQCAGGYYYNSWLGMIRPALPKYGLDGGQPGLDRPLDYVSGASMLISSEVIRDIGMLSEDYFLYYEELDYAQRIRNKKTLQWCKQSRLVHFACGSTRSHGELGRVLEYHSIKSLLIYTNKFYPYKIPSVLIALLLAKPFLYVLRNEMNLFKALFAAVANFFTGREEKKFYPESSGY